MPVLPHWGGNDEKGGLKGPGSGVNIAIRCKLGNGCSSARPQKVEDVRHSSHGNRYQPRKCEVAELLLDCDSFVTGQLIFRRSRRMRNSASIYWLNTLAHGDRTDIDQLQKRCFLRGARSGALARFAIEQTLTTLDHLGWPLERLQRNYLLPVELTCLTRSHLTPTQVADMVSNALEAAQRSTRTFGPSTKVTPRQESDPPNHGRGTSSDGKRY